MVTLQPTSYRYDIVLPFDSYNQSILLAVAMTLDCSYITGMTSHVYAYTSKVCSGRRLSPFPAKEIKVPKPLKKLQVKLHCICRLPKFGEEEMAYCPSCNV